MQHIAVIDVYTSKLCSLAMFRVITCPLCGSVGPGVTDRALALTETDIERESHYFNEADRKVSCGG